MSWGHYFRTSQKINSLNWRSENLSKISQPFLPYGNGRSYGDVCLNSTGVIVPMQRLNNFISFDEEKGILICEAGTLLSEILAVTIPKGWFLNIVPGTRFITVGGAIANDVHGKNHHIDGTFCHHVKKFSLIRSDKSDEILCSANQNPELFSATIGGLGLTGIILWAELQLKKISSVKINQKTIIMKNLDHFLELSENAKNSQEYIVSWVDCLAKSGKLGRGIFTCGNHAQNTEKLPEKITDKIINFPIEMPFSLINKMSIKTFNHFYLCKENQGAEKEKLVHYNQFFFPLDGLGQWNRIYGKKGFMQYQCVIPPQDLRNNLIRLFETISNSRQGSFLTVMKVMGAKKSLGLLSFAREGVSVAIDFPFLGEDTKILFKALDKIIENCGGAIYPAKDSLMSAEIFRASFPNYKKIHEIKDPNITSDFWQRVNK